LRTFKQNTILVGDINLPNIDWDEERSDAKGRELLETVIEENYNNWSVSQPTRREIFWTS
jgi:hypothetical protein